MAGQKPKLTPNDFDPEVLRLFDKYVHGGIDRRGFLDGAAKFAVGGLTAAGLLEALSPKFAQAQQVPAADPRIKTQTIEFASPKGYGKARGYLVRPANATGPLPTVLVVHENRGLNPHIEDITRRLALDNFIAFAPDALFPLGGYPGDEDKARELFGKLEQPKTQEDFLAAAAYLKTVAGGNDERINAMWPPYEAALKAANVKFEAVEYPGTQHGFNNDTTPRFDDKAAKASWQRTVALFNSTLRG